MLYLLSFGDTRYKKSQAKLVKSALKFGVDEVMLINQFDLFKDTDFIVKNRYTLRQKRGYGYWLWKPYLVDKTLKTLKDDDILFYCDSAVEILQPLKLLLDKMDTTHPLMFHVDHTNLSYVKRVIYEAMKIEPKDYESYQKASQIAAGYAFFRKNDFTLNLVKEWLELCETPFLIDDTPTPRLDEFPGFIDNRHDQALLSMLKHKYDIKTYRDPSQYGMKYKDFDTQVFNLHRLRIHKWFHREKFPFYYQWKELNSKDCK
ncbi:hypothetical protein BKH43_02740 [Helicobacter sp. 13S00401-1]|uniref:hypothetical protein n=1 Tax=Helicobacter sp. 13S00401-1 TaxID=1905758 RepID=UPI000BA69AB4|nr:hypothetical protein [Helicobacter sp. 13S00401-1]PAF51140.1 hypothetical protein BKH43_02740 [Helicobacter sp. 13S00401-1]